MTNLSESFEKALKDMADCEEPNHVCYECCQRIEAAHAREVAAARRDTAHEMLEWLLADDISEYEDARWALNQMLAAARREAFAEAKEEFLDRVCQKSNSLRYRAKPLFEDWLESRARAGGGTKGGRS